MLTMQTCLHLLKGGRLHVLHALKYAQDSGLGGVGWGWLAAQTGYGKSAVNDALQGLATASPPLVQRLRHYEGWCLHPNALVLPIFPEAVLEERFTREASGKIPPPPATSVEAEPAANIASELAEVKARLAMVEACLTDSAPPPFPPATAPSTTSPPATTQPVLAENQLSPTPLPRNQPKKAVFQARQADSVSHDHDHNEMIINNHNDELDQEVADGLTERITALSSADDELINRLTAIGFDQARRRLTTLPRYELAAWLLWWEWLPRERRELIKRPAGFIRSRLQKKLWPDELAALWSAAANEPAPPYPASQPAEPPASESALLSPVAPISSPQPPEARIWQTALDELALQMTSATFNSWLADSKLVAAVEGVYTVLVRNEYAQDWLENRFKAMILRTLRVVAGGRVEVAFVIE